MTVNPFESAYELIARATKHANDLESELRAFIDSKPYSIVVQTEPQTGDQIHIVRPTIAPKDLKILAFDASNSFRAALDHAVYGSAVALGKHKPRATKFPFGDTAIDLDGDIKGKCRDVHPDICDLIRSLKPYKAGNMCLWGLNKMRNEKIHRILIPMATIGRGFGGPGYIHTIRGPVTMFPDDPFGLPKGELVFLRVPSNGEVDYQIEPVIQVRISEIEGIPGPEATSFFGYLTKAINQIVRNIENRTGLIPRRAAGSV